MRKSKYLLLKFLVLTMFLMSSMIERVGALTTDIIEKELIYNIDLGSQEVTPKYSNSYERYNIRDVSETIRGLELTASVQLRVVIHVNEATGVITSYSGPYLEPIRMYAGPYFVWLTDMSTSQSLSSSRRTLYCEGNFRIHAQTSLGMDIHESKLFTIALNASI